MKKEIINFRKGIVNIINVDTGEIVSQRKMSFEEYRKETIDFIADLVQHIEKAEQEVSHAKKVARYFLRGNNPAE